MAKAKKTPLDELNETWAKVEKLGFSIVKAKSGQFYAVTRSETAGTSVVQYDHQQAMDELHWLLLEANQTISKPLLNEALAYQARKAKNTLAEEVSLRVAERDGRHFLDLCDANGQVIEITKNGWGLAKNCPVLFSRPNKALPLPVPDGTIEPDELGQALLLDKPQTQMVLAWLLSALNERVDPFALVLQGEPGGGKSSLAKFLLSVVDPREAGQVRLDWSSENLLLTAAERRVLLLEEVPHMTADKVATVNGIVTGISHCTRMKFKTWETYNVFVQRPVIITGNSNLLSNPALLDRSLPIFRKRIRAGAFESSEVVFKRLEDMKPRILGLLLDLMVAGLKQSEPGYDRLRQLRMAGAAEWVGRCFTGKGMSANSFLDAVEEAHTRATTPQIEDWPAYEALHTVASVGFYGEMRGLLDRLEETAPECCDRDGWPKDPSVLGRELRKWDQIGALTAKGIQFEAKTETGNRRTCRLSLLNQACPDDCSVTSGEPVGNTQYPAITLRAFAINEAAPNLLVCQKLNDGGADLWGCCADQAGQIVNRPVENQIIRLSKNEWEAVQDLLDHEGICHL